MHIHIYVLYVCSTCPIHKTPWKLRLPQRINHMHLLDSNIQFQDIPGIPWQGFPTVSLLPSPTSSCFLLGVTMWRKYNTKQHKQLFTETHHTPDSTIFIRIGSLSPGAASLSESAAFSRVRGYLKWMKMHINSLSWTRRLDRSHYPACQVHLSGTSLQPKRKHVQTSYFYIQFKPLHAVTCIAEAAKTASQESSVSSS